MDIAILLVEPNPADAQAITDSLTSIAEVTRVQHVSEAHNIFGLRMFDLIISEYHLPDGHGFDLLHLECPLLLLTTERDPHAIVRAMQHGISNYTFKDEGYLSKLRLTATEIVNDARQEQVTAHLTFGEKVAGRLRLTPDCRPISCSEKAAEILGYASPEEALTQPSWRAHFAIELQRTWEKAIAQGAVQQNVHSLLYNLERHPLNVLCNVAAVPRPDGTLFIDIVFLNVTDRLLEANRSDSKPPDTGVLKKSRTWIHHILNNTSDVILVTDATGHIHHANERFETMFFHSPPETIFSLFEPPHDLTIASLMDDAAAYNMRLMDEAVIKQVDGTPLYVEVNIASIDMDDGPRRLIITLHDINDRKQAAQRLAQSEADLRAIFESTAVGFMLLDTDMSIRTANGMATTIVHEILGFTLTGDDRMDDVVLPEYLQEFVEAFNQALKGEVIHEEVNIPALSGERRDYSLTFIPVQNDRDAIIGVCLSTEDITARKRAERKLSDSESRYRAITELISDYAYALHLAEDGQLALSWITEAPFKRVTGYDAAGLTTIDDIISLVMLPEDRERARRDLKNCLRGQTTSGEYRITTQSGNHRWVHVTRRPIWDDATQRYDTIIGAVRDITTQRKMEQALRDALQQERELNELKTRFIAMVSHEFRTPLATIRASTDMLRTYLDRMTPAQREERFERIGVQVAHMTTLMEDVLSLGRFEAGAQSIEKDEGDLTGFLAALVEEFKQTYPTHTIACHLPTESVMVPFDKRLMRQITVNMLTNAQKYSKPGSTITLTVEAAPSLVEIAVRDEGIGIPESDLQKLFTAFHRASNVGTVQGTGLGLSILKHAVDLHEGHITVASEVGQGTTFAVTLPR